MEKEELLPGIKNVKPLKVKQHIVSEYTERPME